MSSMLDRALDTGRTALEAGLLLRVETLEADKATLESELSGLAKAVHAWAVESDLGRDPKVQGDLIDQMVLRAAEVLDLEGMRQAAAERLAGQATLL